MATSPAAPPVTIDLLRLLREIEALGSISAAARRLDLSPSVATRRLEALERALNTPLFLRTTRRLKLTEGGRIALDWAQRTLDGHALMVDDLAGLNGEAAGEVRVALSDHATTSFLTPFLTEFLPRFPGLRITISTTDRLVDLVESNVDLALHTGRIPDSRLIAKRISGLNRILCASPDYLSRRGMPATPSDLERHSCLIHSATEPSAWYFRKGGQLIRQPITPLVSVDSYYPLAEMARRGLGIIRISRNVVRDDLKSGRLVKVLQDFECAHRSGEMPAVWLLYPDRHVLRRTRIFIDEFSQYMQGALS